MSTLTQSYLIIEFSFFFFKSGKYQELLNLTKLDLLIVTLYNFSLNQTISRDLF